MDWGKIWDDIVNYFSTNGWNILFFFVILILGIIIIKIIMTVLRKILSKTKMEKNRTTIYLHSGQVLFVACFNFGTALSNWHRNYRNFNSN